MKQKTTRFALTLLLSVLTTIGAWAQSPIGSIQYNRTGGYYEIGSTDNLNDLTVYVNGSGSYTTGGDTETTAHDCTGLTFKQTTNITYSHGDDANEDVYASNYTAIGFWGQDNSDYHPFKGTFDGQGHTISGIRIYKGGSSNTDVNQGLFGIIEGATIRGITLADTRITGYGIIGSIVGCSGTGSTISDCHVTATVAIHAVQFNVQDFGGIVGMNCGTVSYCTSAVTLTKTNSDKDYYFGGIAGLNAGNGNLSNNLAFGAVVPSTGDNCYGAICGGNDTDATLSHNYYYGCTVGGVTDATDVGSGNIRKGSTSVVADVTENDGAVHLSQAPIPYVNANGQTAYCTNFTILQGGGATTLQPGWYVVNSDISYTGTVTIGNGEATIILCNGKTMNVGTSESRINNKGINDGSSNHSSALTIYGQSLDDATAGHLNIYTTGIGDDGINLYSSYTQHSGNVTISTTGSQAYGIYAAGGFTLNGGTLSVTVGNTLAICCSNATITGGKLDATVGSSTQYGLCANGNITLGYTNASDYIHASSYAGTVNIAYGQVFTDGNGNNFYGTITDASTIAGKMLTPSNTFSVAANQNPAAVGEYWATFHNPVAGYTVPSGTTAYIGTVNGSSLTLTEVEGGFIPAGNAVILKGTSASFDLSRADTGDAFDFTANELKGGSTVADGKVAYTLAAKNGVVGFYKFAGTLNPNKAHLEITPPPAQSAPAFFGFGGSGENTTAINAPESHASTELSGDYYTLDGRKLQGKPTQKGIYVRNGRKIIIK